MHSIERRFTTSSRSTDHNAGIIASRCQRSLTRHRDFTLTPYPRALTIVFCQHAASSLVPNIELSGLKAKTRHLNIALHNKLQQSRNSNNTRVQVCWQEFVIDKVIIVRTFEPPAHSFHLSNRQVKTAELGGSHEFLDRDCFEVEA